MHFQIRPLRSGLPPYYSCGAAIRVVLSVDRLPSDVNANAPIVR